MQNITIKQYAAGYEITRQAVEDRIRRGTLPVVFVNVKVREKRIQIEDTEYEKIKGKLVRVLASSKEG